MTRALALKIDVDTYRGIADGGERLTKFLRAEKIPASFFVSLGPDNSGWAATRVFRHRGFMKKMQRTSAVSLYGWRTVLSGTLWPARPMGTSFLATLRQWREWGFEVSPHGYDHIRWHDRAARWSEKDAADELKRTAEVYRYIFNEAPSSFAAPGWQAGAGSWSAMESMDLLYHSDTRGEGPYFPSVDGRVLKTLEIPTTLPTWDEMLTWDDVRPETLVEKTGALLRNALNVWTIHAEVEGTAYFSFFEAFVRRAKAEQVEWVSLPALAKTLRSKAASVPTHAMVQGERLGRAGPVSVQGVVEFARA